MFEWLKMKRPVKSKVELRDVLFGDMPLSEWPSSSQNSQAEPWRFFVAARDCLNSKEDDHAIEIYKNILSMNDLESRHYLQAWHFLREVGFCPGDDLKERLYGVVVEVPMKNGYDILAVYADHTARYFNYSGAAVVWDAPDSSMNELVDQLLNVAKPVLCVAGPWVGARPSPPQNGDARISLLTPFGLHFGQASFSALASDSLSGPLIIHATKVMQELIRKVDKK